MGARPLSRKIDELIRVPLSKKILFERLSDCDIQINLDQDQLVFVPSASTVIPHVDNDGMIQV
jgi:ATP-dependent Clp protease ATP-binding subunit ClpA